MAQGFLSDIELYFSIYLTGNQISVTGEECHHIMKVMRHSVGDIIYVTNGNGNIFKAKITSTAKNEVKAEIIDTYSYQNKFENVTICIPRLRVNDRLEFALEKCVELGFTKFVLFESERTIAKGDKSDRWKKILLAAMKQSLRSFLPSVKYFNSFQKIDSLEGEKILFDQNSEQLFSLSIDKFLPEKKCNLIFGPEGGLSDDEIKLLSNKTIYRLTSNRLRSETAVITAAAIISNLLQ